MHRKTRHHLTALMLTALVTLASGRPNSFIPAHVPGPGIPAALQPEIAKAFRSVNPQSIRATMSFLADDLLEGRQPGTRGFAIASRYIQSQFMALGLLPGVHGSYVQPVPLKKGVTIPDASTMTIDGSDGTQTLACNTDFLVSPNLV